MFSSTLFRSSTRGAFSRTFATSVNSALKARMLEVAPKKYNELKDVKRLYANHELGKYTVDQVIGGMRGMYGLLYDTSLVDPLTGITFRGYTIQELKAQLPKAPKGDEPLPEGVLWLLMTGDIPSDADVQNLSKELKSRSTLTPDIINFILALPKDLHPMSQLSASLLYLQRGSKFAKAYRQGIPKIQYWEYVLDDALDLLAKLPQIAAIIYRHTYKNDALIQPDSHLDWAGNFAHMLGYDKFEILECIRGYLTIHSDHEGGNVSAHATHLVGSALADPYLSYSAGLNGLAGPLHGLANQEVLRWLLDLRDELGDNPSEERVRDFTWNTLKAGKVIPGYGHAVLRHTDPRYLHQREFAEKYIRDDPLVNLTRTVYKVVPPVLRELGKVKNPWPNVDAHSGVLLYHYGMKEFDYYTVVFAVSRAIGCMSSQVWSRIFGLPIERPQSVTLKWIRENIGKEE